MQINSSKDHSISASSRSPLYSQLPLSRSRFSSQELNPVNSRTVNYASVAVEIVLTYALAFWAISARRWFAEPIKQIAGHRGRCARYLLLR